MIQQATDSAVRLPRSRLLDALPDVIYGFTRRLSGSDMAEGNVGYGQSRSKDDAWRMRQYWSTAIGVDPDRLTLIAQHHGSSVLCVGEEQAGQGAKPGSAPAGPADAIVTNASALPLMTLHADCVPLLLADPVRRVVGVVHAGWRGTIAGIAPSAVREMVRLYGTNPGDIVACIGPTIGRCCYEVGSEVLASWVSFAGECAELAIDQHRSVFDLPAANRLLLQQGGVLPHHIEDMSICTRCRGDQWFSHRGQGSNTGRFGAIIALRAGSISGRG